MGVCSDCSTQRTSPTRSGHLQRPLNAQNLANTALSICSDYSKHRTSPTRHASLQRLCNAAEIKSWTATCTADVRADFEASGCDPKVFDIEKNAQSPKSESVLVFLECAPDPPRRPNELTLIFLVLVWCLPLHDVLCLKLFFFFI